MGDSLPLYGYQGDVGRRRPDGQVRPVVFEAQPRRLRLSARGDEVGEAEGEVPAAVEGESQAVVLNSRLLVDLLETVDRSADRTHLVEPPVPSRGP